MKKFSTILSALAMLASVVVQAQTEVVTDQVSTYVVDQIRNIVDNDMAASFKKIPLKKGETITILPLNGDTSDDLVGGLIKNAATKAGLTIVEAKDSALLDEILKEIAWDERKSDILDSETVTKLGQLKGTENYLYGKVLSTEENDKFVFLHIELHMTSVATKQHIWGDVFSRRAFIPGANQPQGLSAIPTDIRETVKTDITSYVMKSISKAPNASTVKTVAIVPLAGDEDLYVTHCIQDALSQKGYFPKDLGVSTMAEAVYLLAEDSSRADSVLSGVVRELSIEQEPEPEFPTNHIFNVVAEVQVKLEKSGTREILWSDTIFSKVRIEKELTQAELEVQDETVFSTIITLVGYGVGIIIVLFIIVKFLGALTRVR